MLISWGYVWVSMLCSGRLVNCLLSKLPDKVYPPSDFLRPGEGFSFQAQHLLFKSIAAGFASGSASRIAARWGVASGWIIAVGWGSRRRIGRGNLLHHLAVSIVAGDVDGSLFEFLLDVGVRHEDDVSAGDEVGAHLVHILYGGRVKTESEAAQSWHSHAVAPRWPMLQSLRLWPTIRR